MADSNVLDIIKKHMNSEMRFPNPGSQVYKDECVFSFDTPESETGLYLNLTSHLSYGKDYVQLDHERTGQHIYLHQKWTKVMEEQPETTNKEKPTKLAIGTEDGFQLDQEKFHFDKEYKIVVAPTMESVPYPNDALPTGLEMCVKQILEMDDASKQETVAQCKFTIFQM